MPKLRIPVTRFVRAEVLGDGRAVKLTFAAQDGRVVALSLPESCLGDMLASLPAGAERPAGTVREVRAWSLVETEAAPAGLKLTLQTAEGEALTFRITSSQISGIATLATFGGLCAATARTIN